MKMTARRAAGARRRSIAWSTSRARAPTRTTRRRRAACEQSIVDELDRLERIPRAELLDRRYARYRSIGEFTTVARPRSSRRSGRADGPVAQPRRRRDWRRPHASVRRVVATTRSRRRGTRSSPAMADDRSRRAATDVPVRRDAEARLRDHAADRPPGGRAAARPASAVSRRPVSARSRSARTTGGSACDDRPTASRPGAPTVPPADGSTARRTGRLDPPARTGIAPRAANRGGGRQATPARQRPPASGSTTAPAPDADRRVAATSPAVGVFQPRPEVAPGRAGPRRATGSPSSTCSACRRTSSRRTTASSSTTLVEAGEGVEYGQELILIEPPSAAAR